MASYPPATLGVKASHFHLIQEESQRGCWGSMYSNILIIDFYQQVFIIPFDIGTVLSGGVFISPSHGSKQLVIISDRFCFNSCCHGPMPRISRTESGHGSWSAISLHSSSWDGSADLTPGGVLLGGCSGLSFQFSSSSIFAVKLVAVKASLSAVLQPHIPCRGLLSWGSYQPCGSAQLL